MGAKPPVHEAVQSLLSSGYAKQLHNALMRDLIFNFKIKLNE
jgi:hypothetical protein